MTPYNATDMTRAIRVGHGLEDEPMTGRPSRTTPPRRLQRLLILATSKLGAARAS